MEAEVEDTDEVVGLLSLQFFLADVPDKAWTYSVRAGEKAQEIYANAESARYYRRAIEAAKKGGVEKEELLGAYEALWQACCTQGSTKTRQGSTPRPVPWTHDTRFASRVW